MFRFEYTPDSLQLISRMENWQRTYAPRLAEASSKGADIIIETIPTVTSWKTGNGTLDHSFYKADSTPFGSAVTSDLPYAHRQSEGFHGMDSLGRHYEYDGTQYAQKALDAASSRIEDEYIKSTEQTIIDIGGH